MGEGYDDTGCERDPEHDDTGCERDPEHGRVRSCGREDCLDKSGHLNDPWIFVGGPGGTVRVLTCATKGCTRVLYRCEMTAESYGQHKVGLEPREGYVCRTCLANTAGRDVVGCCPATTLAGWAHDRQEYVAGIASLKKFMCEAANPGDKAAEIALSVQETLLEALDALLEDVPDGRKIAVAVQKASGDQLLEFYDLFFGGPEGDGRDSIKAILQSVGGKLPAADGHNLLMAAHGPQMREDVACKSESDTQFAVHSRVLEGEQPLTNLIAALKNLLALFSRAVCARYETGGGRQAPANGQGGGQLNSSVGVAVWYVDEVETLEEIVRTTPCGFERVGGCGLGDAPLPRLAYGPSEKMIDRARSTEFRAHKDEWTMPDRRQAIKRCYEILRSNPQVVAIDAFSPRPWRGSVGSGSDSTTVYQALKRMRDEWGTWQHRATQVYETLKKTVYDRQARGEKTWAELSSR